MFEYLFIAFIVIFCIQFIYNIFIFGAFSFAKKKESNSNFQQPVSVIICAKNEAENLIKNIPFFYQKNNMDCYFFELLSLYNFLRTFLV